jgi:hypothetical protein
VYYALEKYEQAVIYYERYLELASSDMLVEYDYVEARITEMQAALAGQ